ncbi:hypothetical protein C8F01DRAFT_1137618 [Mycena amicta]|nr:hypothetical protein C8F01DRAFT_1137618 [Mycena amicta]
MDVDSEHIVPRRIEDLWFEDGNMVLQAGSAQYKVYRGTLSRQSPVFEDMLAFPQPPDAELLDGFPVVHLHDPEVEVTPFLKALFEPDYFRPHPQDTDPEAIYGCLRLSHKYAVDFLRRRALVHFSSGFSTTLRDFESDSTASWTYPPHSHFRWINLARKTDALWTLPHLFYLLATYFDDLGLKIFHGDGTVDSDTTLSLQDQAALLAGLSGQINASRDVIDFLHSGPVAHCATKLSCALATLHAGAESREFFHEAHCNPLEIWLARDWELLQGACPSCCMAQRESHRVAREKFWDELPGIYGLPSWTVLQAMKDAALRED